MEAPGPWPLWPMPKSGPAGFSLAEIVKLVYNVKYMLASENSGLTFAFAPQCRIL